MSITVKEAQEKYRAHIDREVALQVASIRANLAHILKGLYHLEVKTSEVLGQTDFFLECMLWSDGRWQRVGSRMILTHEQILRTDARAQAQLVRDFLSFIERNGEE